MHSNNTERFNNRVEDYVKYRPGYPVEIVRYLEEAFGMVNGSSIADIGSGTGISSALFLDAGYSVVGIEPNMEMREKSKFELRNFSYYLALDGSAEQTRLPAQSADVIVAGQAFHWFDREKAKTEFSRILRPGGLVVLMWNERLVASKFEKDYDRLIVRHARDYVKVGHRNIGLSKISEFFGNNPVEMKIFQNRQVLDFAGLEGRLLSSSYMPTKDDERYKEISKDLNNLFERYQENGLISINYETKVFAGRWNNSWQPKYLF